jgi:hypothetical protein
VKIIQDRFINRRGGDPDVPFLSRVEVYATMDPVLFSCARRALEKKQISYTCKSETMGRANRGGGIPGSFGEDQNSKMFYYIYTKRKDAPLASGVISESIKSRT